jgi:hypothetical protein
MSRRGFLLGLVALGLAFGLTVRLFPPPRAPSTANALRQMVLAISPPPPPPSFLDRLRARLGW